MVYTIGEMAKMLGVPASTLRYYDKEGLLPFVERSGGGIRMFKDSDFEWLSIIECLKQTGMPLREIRDFIDWCMEGDATIGQRKDLIEKRRQAVLETTALRLRNGITSKLSESGRFIQLTEQFIKMASPDYILKRGYSLALKDGKIIKHASDLRAGEELTTRFIDGEIKSIIKP